MLGLLRWKEGDWGRVRVERERLLGMSVAAVCLPREGWLARRQLARAARLLRRQGVRRVLVPEDFTGWDVLGAQGLAPVDPVPLYRAMAAPLVLALLEREGVRAERAVVELRGERVDESLAAAARQLCPRVRRLVLEVPGGPWLARALYWEFGAAAQGPADEVSARVCFSGPGQPGELRLCGPDPDLLGLRLDAPQVQVPDGLEPDRVYTALWQAGRLALSDLRIRPGPARIALDRPG